MSVCSLLISETSQTAGPLALKSSFSRFPGLLPGLGKHKAFGPKNQLLRNFKTHAAGWRFKDSLIKSVYRLLR
jgi:hypothetical protein